MDETKVVAFEFSPGEKVTVIHLGLNYKGRVSRSIWTAGSKRCYDVEYNVDGEIRSREFWEDEIAHG